MNRYSKMFGKAWENYIDVNPTEIIMTGKKTTFMNEKPVFKLIGSFSGWEENDMKKDIMSENETTVKFKISDLKKCWSQPNVMDGSGCIDNIVTNDLNISKFNPDKTLVAGLVVGKYYCVGLIFEKVVETHFRIYDDYQNIIKNMYPIKSNKLEFKFKATTPSIYIDFMGIDENNVLKTVKYGELNGAIKCPIDNIKANIDDITVGNRTFKVEGQKLSASNVLMVVYLSNNS